MSVVSRSERDQQKVVAAIVAGVSAYLDEEAGARESSAQRARPAPLFNLWSLAGRQEIMRMRTLWQRRIA
jgi:hypothetical protein